MHAARIATDGITSHSDLVGFEISFWIAAENRVEFLQTADALLSLEGVVPESPSRACFEKMGAANRFLWQEEWRSRAAMEERLRSRHVTTLLGAIAVLGGMEGLRVLAWVERAATDREAS